MVALADQKEKNTHKKEEGQTKGMLHQTRREGVSGSSNGLMFNFVSIYLLQYLLNHRGASHPRTCIVLVAPELSDYRKQDQVPAEEEEAEEREDCEEEWAGGE